MLQPKAKRLIVTGPTSGVPTLGAGAAAWLGVGATTLPTVTAAAVTPATTSAATVTTPATTTQSTHTCPNDSGRSTLQLDLRAGPRRMRKADRTT